MKLRIPILVYSIVLFVVASIPSILAKFIISPTGSLKIIGPVVGFFLAFGIYYKWLHIEKIFYFVFGFAIIGDLLILTKSTGNMFLFMLVLSAVHILLLIIFFTSNNIRTHLGIRKKF